MANAERRMKGATRKNAGRRPSSIRVHIENSRKYASVFWITPERYEAGLARHAALAPRVETTIGWDLEDFDREMPTADVLVGWNFPRDDLARRAPKLRWIHLTGAGVEHLTPLQWLPPHVDLTNNSGVHAPKASEFGLTAILMLNSRIPAYATNQRHGTWEQTFTGPVAGKTLAIIGVGSIGGAVAKRAGQFGMTVLGVRRSRRPKAGIAEMFGPDALDKVLPRADFVLITAPLTSSTRGLIGRAQLDLMRPHAGLVNMGRAGIVDYEALADKLTRGELSGAILDVFDPEPLPAHSRLWTTPNLIVTPHVSSDAPDYVDRTLDLFFSNLQRYLQGRPLRNRVDAVREY